MDDQNTQGNQITSVNTDPNAASSQPTAGTPQASIPTVSPSTPNPPPKNNPYTVPIIINIVSGIIYSLLLVMNIVVLYRTIKFLNVTGPLGRQSLPMAIIPVVALVLVVLANFGYVFFLNSKKSKGEIVSKALLSSLLIAIPPIIVQISMFFLAMYSTVLIK